MPRFSGGLVKHLGKRLVVKTNEADVSMTVEELETAFFGVDLVTA